MVGSFFEVIKNCISGRVNMSGRVGMRFYDSSAPLCRSEIFFQKHSIDASKIFLACLQNLLSCFVVLLEKLSHVFLVNESFVTQKVLFPSGTEGEGVGEANKHP